MNKRASSCRVHPAPCFAVRLANRASHVLLASVSLQPQMEAFNHLMLEYPELLYSGVGATAFLAGGALIYKFVTRYELIRTRFYLFTRCSPRLRNVVYNSSLWFETSE